MNRFYMWLRAPELALLVIGLAALTFIHSRELLHWAYVDAIAASAEYRQSLTLAGIVAASISAWTGSRIASTRVVYCVPGARRRGYPLALRQFLELASAAVGGMVLGLLPVTVWAVSGTSLGALEVSVIVSGIVGMLAFVAAGYLVGVLLASSLAAPATAALSFAWVVFTGDHGRLTSPVWPFDVEAGFHEPLDVTVIRIAYFGVMTSLFLGAAGWWLRERNLRVMPSALPGVVAFLIPFLVITTVANGREGNVIEKGVPTAACAAVPNGTQVCVHSARAELLPSLSRRVGQIVDILGPRNSGIAEVADATLWRENVPERINLQLQTQDSNRWLEHATEDMASVIAGLPACYRSAGGAEAGEQAAASSAVAAWLLSQVHGEPRDVLRSSEATDAFARLNRMPPTQAKEYVVDNIDELKSCDVSADEV